MEEHENPKIAVIGGYGGMGKFFAELFAKQGFQVIIAGPNEVAGKDVAKKIKAEYAKNNVQAVSHADVVMISVPINATAGVIKEVAPRMRKGSVLMDVTSVKEEPCRLMDEYAPRGVEVIGTHPIFSHRVGSLEGQVFVLTPVRGDKWLAWFRGFLARNKARLFETTPEEHDHVMAVVQGLTHYTYIAVGKTLDKLDFDIKESRKFASPVYELMLDMIGRVIGQNPALYAEIQMSNPEIPAIHDIFLETARELSDAVKEKDEKRFVEMMKQAARNFDDLERAMGRSDKAIKSLIAELDFLKSSVGKEICLRHIYSGKTHIGVVKSVNPETVVLEEGGKSSELKISNLQVLGDEERIECKKEFYGIVERDYSAVFDESVDEPFIVALLKGFDENIAEVSVKDVYRGKKIGEGKKSVCFKTCIIDSEIKKTEKRIGEFFKGIGGSLR